MEAEIRSRFNPAVSSEWEKPRGAVARRLSMRNLRRQFLWCTGATFAVGICGIPCSALPQSRNMPTPPEPSETEPHAASSAGRTPSQRALLQQHEREFRESLASLSERVNELNKEVAELHSSSIFSVKIYKQSSEIERLAKQLKNLAKN